MISHKPKDGDRNGVGIPPLTPSQPPAGGGLCLALRLPMSAPVGVTLGLRSVTLAGSCDGQKFLPNPDSGSQGWGSPAGLHRRCDSGSRFGLEPGRPGTQECGGSCSPISLVVMGRARVRGRGRSAQVCPLEEGPTGCPAHSPHNNPSGWVWVFVFASEKAEAWGH